MVDGDAKNSVPWKFVAIIAIATLTIYAPAIRFNFVSYDDPTYIIQNSRVAAGLTGENIRWAFSTFYFNNWHPITWLAYFSTSQFFGVNAWSFHLLNIVMHVCNAVLVFLVLTRMTGKAGRSAVVALLFAMHPEHVESVAWVSELKDVLSTLFLLVTIFAYLKFVDRKSAGWYAIALVSFALGLASKSMIVAAPFLLLLLDWWPLRRNESVKWARLVLEKIPLMLMSVGLCVATIFAQQTSVAEASDIGITARIENAISSYGFYIWKAIWPFGLAVYYPHPGSLGESSLGASFVISAIFLLLISVWVVRERVCRPYLLVGWLWFLGMLVPAIGIVQVGDQARADRYTYFPLVGLFVAVVWFVAESSVFTRRRRLIAIAAIVFFAIVCEIQISYWSDSRSLFEHAMKVTDSNYIAMDHLALADVNTGRLSEAEMLALESVRVNGRSAYGYAVLARVYDGMDRPGDSLKSYYIAIQLDPTNLNFGTTRGARWQAWGSLLRQKRSFARRFGCDRTMRMHTPIWVFCSRRQIGWKRRLGSGRPRFRSSTEPADSGSAGGCASREIGDFLACDVQKSLI